MRSWCTTRGRIVWRVLLFVSVLLVVGTVGLATVGAADQKTSNPVFDGTATPSVDNAQATDINVTRTINQSTVAPGEAVRVTITTNLDTVDDPAVYEQVTPTPTGANITATDPDPAVALATDTSDELITVWNSTDHSTIEYVIQLPTNTPDGTTFNITGFVETANDTSTIETGTIVVETPTENGDDDNGNGGAAGGGGGAAPPDEPELDVSFFEDGTETTIRVSDIPRSTVIDVDTDETLTGDGLSLTAFTMDFQFDPDDFRIEATAPTADPTAAEPLPETAGTPVGYLGFDVVGLEPRFVTETTVSFAIAADQLPVDSTHDDVVVYQYADDGWMAVDTDSANTTVTATLADFQAAPLALAVEETATGTDETDTDETDTDETDTDETDTDGSATDTADSDATDDEVPGFGVVIGILSLVVTLAAFRQMTSTAHK